MQVEELTDWTGQADAEFDCCAMWVTVDSTSSPRCVKRWNLSEDVSGVRDAVGGAVYQDHGRRSSLDVPRLHRQRTSVEGLHKLPLSGPRSIMIIPISV